MATKAVQLNTRIDKELKRNGDAVFARHGLTPSEAVRALWEYAAKNQDLPPFMQNDAGSIARNSNPELERKLLLARDGAGLALRVAKEQCGYVGSDSITLSEQEWDSLIDRAYDDMLDEMEASCRD